MVAIAAMSFTITIQPGLFKNDPVDISQCYRGVANLKFLMGCNPTTWSAVQTNCANKVFIEGNYVHKDLGLSNFQPNTETCEGDDIICCIRFFETTTPPPCGAGDSKHGEVDESTGQVGLGTKFIKVLQMECKWDTR
jgi:hypothetical protein